MGFLCALPLSVSRFTVAAACLPATGRSSGEQRGGQSPSSQQLSAEHHCRASLLPAVHRHAARWVAATACLRAGGRSTPAVPFAVLHPPTCPAARLFARGLPHCLICRSLPAESKCEGEVPLGAGFSPFFSLPLSLIYQTVLVNAAADFVVNSELNAAKCWVEILSDGALLGVTVGVILHVN